MLLQPQDKQGPGKSFSQGHQPHWFQNTSATPKGPGQTWCAQHAPTTHEKWIQSSSRALAALGRQQQFAEVEKQLQVPVPSPEGSTEPRTLPSLSLGAHEPLQQPEVPAGSLQECAVLLSRTFPRTPRTPLPARAAGLRMSQGGQA